MAGDLLPVHTRGLRHGGACIAMSRSTSDLTLRGLPQSFSAAGDVPHGLFPVLAASQNERRAVRVQGYIFGGLIAGPLGWRAAFLLEAAAMAPFVAFCTFAPAISLRGMQDEGCAPGQSSCALPPPAQGP